MFLRSLTEDDWPAVADIYFQGIATDHATFEQEVPSYSAWDKAHRKNCRIVAEHEGKLLGWTALSPVSNRYVYRGVAEVSIYISTAHRGKGVGLVLMEQLIMESEQAGYWTLQSGIFPENIASIRLHEKVGFRFLGKRTRIAKTKQGIWKDNLLFERRSPTVGIQ